MGSKRLLLPYNFLLISACHQVVHKHLRGVHGLQVSRTICSKSILCFFEPFSVER